MTNIEKLAARLATRTRKPEWASSVADWPRYIQTTIENFLAIIDCEASYPVVGLQDVKPGEHYWVLREHGQQWIMWSVDDNRMAVIDVVGAVEIRGPIPRPE